VFVREGKGRKDRVVPLGARAAAWLDRYLTEARPRLLGQAREELFVTDWGQPITPEQVATAVRRAKQRAGVTKPGATHLLRHACATHMLDGGADVRQRKLIPTVDGQRFGLQAGFGAMAAL
jgi:integrase/recombinase XerD